MIYNRYSLSYDRPKKTKLCDVSFVHLKFSNCVYQTYPKEGELKV